MVRKVGDVGRAQPCSARARAAPGLNPRSAPAPRRYPPRAADAPSVLQSPRPEWWPQTRPADERRVAATKSKALAPAADQVSAHASTRVEGTIILQVASPTSRQADDDRAGSPTDVMASPGL